MNFPPVDITTRVRAAFGLVVILLLAVVAVAQLNMGAMLGASTHLAKSRLPAIEHVGDIDIAMTDLRLKTVQRSLASDEAARTPLDQEIARAQTELAKARKDFAEHIASAQEIGRAHV